MPPKTSVKQNFLQGALILSAGTAIVKVIGALFKIPLQNLIGPMGMVHFNTAYDIYSTLFVISTAGLPVAVSKMVSEANVKRRTDEARAIFRTAVSSFCIIGGIFSIAMFFGARVAAGWMNNPDAYMAVQAIAPAVLFVAIMSAFRGFFQGHGNMIPTAVSQIIEALCKLGIGFLLAALIFNSFMGSSLNTADQERVSQIALEIVSEQEQEGEIITLEAATEQAKERMAAEPSAAGAIAGISAGSVIGVVYLTARYFRKKKKHPAANVSPIVRPRGKLLRELLRLAIPVTISSSVLTLTNLIDNALVMGRLTPIVGYEHAKFLNGSYGFARTLFNLPQAFILTLAVSIIPVLSAALLKKDNKTVDQTISSSLRVTSLLAFPAAAGLIALAFPILHLLNGVAQPEAVATAAPLLRTLGFAVPFVCVVSLTNAILQSMGKVGIPILTMLVGGASKIAVNYLLVGNPDINIAGAPIGTVVCYLLITGLNLFFVARYISSARFLAVFVKPLCAAAAMGFASLGLYTLLTNVVGLGVSVSVVLTMVAAVIFYLLLILLLKTLTREDVLLFPKGEKLVRLLRLK